MANRLEQLNIAYKKALGTILRQEFSELTNLTVVDFLIDPSTQTARAFLAATPQTLKQLNIERGKIQSLLQTKVKTRYTPKLTFILDDKYLEKVDQLFEKLHHEN